MSSHLAYLVLGLGGGAVIAALGIGVVMTGRSSGVVNFAHAAVGAFLAFSFFEFRETGDLVLPWFGLPNRVHLLPRPTAGTALVVFALYGAVLGVVIERLVFRPLRRAPAVGRVVASVGLFLYAWSLIGLEWSVTPVVRPILWNDNVRVLGRLVGGDRLVLAGVVAVLAGVLWALGRHTRFGLATEAAAENEKAALLAGLDPGRLASVNWAVATSLAGLAMILAAQIVALDALSNSLLIVPALAAALVGDFRSYPVVAAAGFGIGMLQSEVLNLQAEVEWLPRIGLQQGLPFLIILVAVVVRGGGLPSRGALPERHHPAAVEPRGVGAVTVVGVAAAVAVLAAGPSDWRAALITSSIFALLALSVVVLTGFVGQISFAPYAFAGCAAFAMVRLHDAGLPFPVAPLVAATLAGGLGLLVGLPAVRVRGLNLAIVTLGAAVAIQELLFRWDWFVGDGSSTDVPEPSLGPVDLTIRAAGDAYPRAAFGVLCVAVLVVCGLAVANLRRSTTGLRWLAVRSNERAAAAAGVDVRATKLMAFVISALLAGLAGTLIAYQRLTVSADAFGVFNSLTLLALTYLAGIAVLSGAPTAGALAPVGLLAVLSGQEVGDPSPYQFAVSGLLLVVVSVLYPDGITGGVRALAHRITGRQDPPVAPDTGGTAATDAGNHLPAAPAP